MTDAHYSATALIEEIALLRLQLRTAIDALKAISGRAGELETPDHVAVPFAEVRGLQEEANSALRKIGS